MAKRRMAPMKRWWQLATKTDKERLAKLAKTSVGQLGQLAGRHRNSGPAIAIRIQHGVEKMIEEGSELPTVLRSDLCPACATCEYARKCENR